MIITVCMQIFLQPAYQANTVDYSSVSVVPSENLVSEATNVARNQCCITDFSYWGTPLVFFLHITHCSSVRYTSMSGDSFSILLKSIGTSMWRGNLSTNQQTYTCRHSHTYTALRTIQSHELRMFACIYTFSYFGSR